MRDLTDDVVLMRPVIDALRASGVDPDRVLSCIGLPAGRFPHAAQAAFWKAASEACGEEHVGLFLVQHLPMVHGQFVHYLFLSSATFGTGLRDVLQYVRLLSDTLDARLDVDGERAVLTLAVATDTPRHFAELLVGALIRLFAALSEYEFRPSEVRFRHAEGAPEEHYRAVYGCPVRLASDSCAVLFAAAVLDMMPSRADPRMHEPLARRQLAQVQRLELVLQVRRLIAEWLVDGGATLERVAARLNMPARRLRERLAMAGVRFNDLISDCRCSLAKELLLNSDERIEVIVERTGFSEPSTFYRAFKRWVGETPVVFRKRGKD